MSSKNTVVEEHDDYVVVDISTVTHPCTYMKIDTEDWNRILKDKSLGKIGAFRPSPRHYLYARLHEKVDGGYKQHLVHRLVCKEWKVINHINLCGDSTGLDNRKCNLEESNPSHNALFKHSNPSRGVSPLKRGGYQAYIKVGITSRKKTFNTYDAAMLWRREQELELIGEELKGRMS